MRSNLSNSELGTNLGIRPMEPLQPSSKTKKKASRYSKRAENAMPKRK